MLLNEYRRGIKAHARLSSRETSNRKSQFDHYRLLAIDSLGNEYAYVSQLKYLPPIETTSETEADAGSDRSVSEDEKK